LRISPATKPQKGVTMDYQSIIIEDTEKGTQSLEVSLVGQWQGILGVHRFLKDQEGRAYWWFVGPRPEGQGMVQRLISFANWDDLENEVGDFFQFNKEPQTGLSKELH
jgi:hypothetical protein